ncbi:MAG: rhomboid family intramembrane serine protease [Bacteroidales bacterium]|nr:rhomboid family intramembrane serine protease [Bacteroidales bacterium]
MTYLIIFITALISVAALYQQELFNRLKFNAWLIHEKKQTYRFFTYGLVHAGWLHLIVNMFVLYSFGGFVEQAFKVIFGTGKGLLNYGMLYLGGIIFATLLDFGKQKNNPHYDAVGASGAVAAVLFSSILLMPTSTLLIFPIPFPIPAWLFGILYMIYSVYMSKKGTDNIGHNAHILGAIFGLVLTIILKPTLVSAFIDQLFG